MSDYDKAPVGLMDCLVIPAEFRWSRFDRFMWHAELFVVGIARVVVVFGILYLAFR